MLRRSQRRRVDPAEAAAAAAAEAAAKAAADDEAAEAEAAAAAVAAEAERAAAVAEIAAALAAGVPPHVPPPPAVYPPPLSSAVTVYCTQREHLLVGSGAVFFSDDRYTVVFCSRKLYNAGQLFPGSTSAVQFCVYFTDKTTKKAFVLQQDRNLKFMLLIVLESEVRTRVTLSYEPIYHEVVRTVGTMAGTRHHPDAKPIAELLYAVGSYTGVVLSPSCESRDVQGNLEPGHESYFIVQCAFQDLLLKRQDIDKRRKISARSLLSAPVFRKNGQLLGVIYTANNYLDSMVGLNVNGILSVICELCGVEISDEPSEENFQGVLLTAAEAYMQNR